MRDVDLLELELPVSGEVDFLVLEVGQLNSQENSVFPLSPLDLWE